MRTDTGAVAVGAVFAPELLREAYSFYIYHEGLTLGCSGWGSQHG